MPRISYKESDLDYEGQLQRLKDRGLTIENDDKVLHLLENISYLRLNGYWHPILTEPKSAKIFKPKAMGFPEEWEKESLWTK
jgi:abortive infection bacteriophage resistance protein